MYLRFLGIGIGGEENQSKGEDGEDLHCSLFDGEVVVEVAVVVVTIVWEDATTPLPFIQWGLWPTGGRI